MSITSVSDNIPLIHKICVREKNFATPRLSVLKIFLRKILYREFHLYGFVGITN